LTGTLFEIPAVIKDAKKHIEAAGLTARCEVVAGDFFASVPEGGDAYLLAHVMQSFDDDRNVVILQNCRRAATWIGEPSINEGNCDRIRRKHHRGRVCSVGVH
jgi:hypothetical protein